MAMGLQAGLETKARLVYRPLGSHSLSHCLCGANTLKGTTLQIDCRHETAIAVITYDTDFPEDCPRNERISTGCYCAFAARRLIMVTSFVVHFIHERTNKNDSAPARTAQVIAVSGIGK